MHHRISAIATAVKFVYNINGSEAGKSAVGFIEEEVIQQTDSYVQHESSVVET
jgi:hypothetical protein